MATPADSGVEWYVEKDSFAGAVYCSFTALATLLSKSRGGTKECVEGLELGEKDEIELSGIRLGPRLGISESGGLYRAVLLLLMGLGL